MTYEPTLEFAHRLDQADPLRAFRERFALPRGGRGEPLVYLCGHSLGLMPLAARGLVIEELDDWAQLAVLGHEHGHRPWIPYHENLRDGLASLTGARGGEVVAMSSLTVNLHLLLAAFYRPNGARRRSSCPLRRARRLSRRKRSRRTSRSTVPRWRSSCGQACNTGPARHSTSAELRARHIAPAPSPDSISPTPSATCHTPCTISRPTSLSGAATSISTPVPGRSAAASSTSDTILLTLQVGGGTRPAPDFAWDLSSTLLPAPPAGRSATHRSSRQLRSSPRWRFSGRRGCKGCGRSR